MSFPSSAGQLPFIAKDAFQYVEEHETVSATQAPNTHASR